MLFPQNSDFVSVFYPDTYTNFLVSQRDRKREVFEKFTTTYVQYEIMCNTMSICLRPARQAATCRADKERLRKTRLLHKLTGFALAKEPLAIELAIDPPHLSVKLTAARGLEIAKQSEFRLSTGSVRIDYQFHADLSGRHYGSADPATTTATATLHQACTSVDAIDNYEIWSPSPSLHSWKTKSHVRHVVARSFHLIGNY